MSTHPASVPAANHAPSESSQLPRDCTFFKSDWRALAPRTTRQFARIRRNFDRDAPLQASLDFNHQVFAEDQVIVEQWYPEDLPLDLHAEAHFPADRSSLACRKGLAAMGFGRSFTA